MHTRHLRSSSTALVLLAALTMLAAGTVDAAAPACAAPPCLDAFLCYKAKAAKAPRGAVPFPQFSPTTRALTDRFGGPFAFDLKKTLALCNPADVDGEDATAPSHPGHFVAYAGKRAKGTPKFARKGALVEVHDALHPNGLQLKVAAEDQTLVASVQATGTGGTAQLPPADLADLKCYKVAVAKAPRGQAPFPAFAPALGVSVVDQFAESRLYDLMKPLRVCHPVIDDAHPAPDDDAEAYLVCYQAKLAKNPKQTKPAKRDVSTNDAFGPEVLQAVAPIELCVPARIVPNADDLIRAVDTVDAQLRMANENFPFLLRGAIPTYYPEIVALIAAGPGAVDRILAEFAPQATLLDDIPLLLFAYALEKIGDPRAVPVLADWLERHVFAELVWAPDFVTHALKVLDGQDGLNLLGFTYLTDEKLDAIAAARAGAARARAVGARATAPPPGDCTARLVVRGINAQGQQDELAFNYTIVRRDIDQRIAEETDPAKKAGLTKLRNDEYLNPDEVAYGGTSYTTLPGAGVSIKSNCGGSVTQNTLNRIAQVKGLPLTLGEGRAAADDIREVARRFGAEVGFAAIDRTTVISHDRSDDSSAHVEVPLATNALGATIFSKDNFGIARSHQVLFGDGVDAAFAPPRNRYGTRSWNPFSPAGTRFYRIDPDRIVDIVLDSSACPCVPGAAGSIPVAITAPAESTTSERVVAVSGTVGDPTVTAGTLRVNGSPQPIVVSGGTFAAQVVLQNGDNTLALAVDAPDGRRGCAERTIKSTAPRTTISATLTWNRNDTDVDLYVTQPDGETAWYGHKATAIGGLLDVDNTRGLGPENYFLSAVEGDQVPTGAYTIAVHYFSDAFADDDTPPRSVGWRVVVVVNEGTPEERREIKTGTIGLASNTNDQPGSSGADWRTATVITIP